MVDSDASTPPDPSLCRPVAAAAPSSKSRAAAGPSSRKPRSRAAAEPSSRKIRSRAAAAPSRAATKASRKSRVAPVPSRATPAPLRAAAKTSRKSRAAAKTSHKSRGASAKTSRKSRASAKILSKSRVDGAACVLVGERVEVFWEGEGEWYAGKVTKVDSDGTYQVYYFSDHEKHWHGSEWDVRTLVESGSSDLV